MKLLHLLIMVKNAGALFKEMLLHNIAYCDMLTVLDTGSTDGTQQAVRDVGGTLYEEPFINFRDSRNRLLDIAGHDCIFNIMLDDSFYITGQLREFLESVKLNTYQPSYGVFISNPKGLTYTSNRIFRTQYDIRYKFLIHEVPDIDLCFLIPKKTVTIVDQSDEYMTNRTDARKQQDLDVLLYQEEATPRTLYYIADTYLCMKDYKNAFKYYKLRTECIDKGFICELQDAYLIMAYISDKYLNKDWTFCFDLYIKSYECDTNRAEALAAIGEHYIENGLDDIAFIFLQLAFEKDITHATFSVYPHIYNHIIPKYLLRLCNERKNFQLGIKCCKRLIQNNYSITLASRWYDIFSLCQEFAMHPSAKKQYNGKKLICMICPSGWEEWNGYTLSEKGLGGSETFVIHYSEYITKYSDYHVVVFCKSSKTVIKDGVEYRSLDLLPDFVNTYVIDICIINRHPEYIQCIHNAGITTIYLVLHDLNRENEIIPLVPSLRQVFCLTEWHRQYFTAEFPMLSDSTSIIRYGINKQIEFKTKRRNSFIYSSFPNRGLYPLLKIFIQLLKYVPDATLNVFCNLEHPFVIEHCNNLGWIKTTIDAYPQITNHGWVKPAILNHYWNISQIWLYPCQFEETCCRTAIEAAASKTLAVTNLLAGLQDTVGNRGVLIPDDITTIVHIITDICHNPQNYQSYIEQNYEWSLQQSYDIVVPKFVNEYL